MKLKLPSLGALPKPEASLTKVPGAPVPPAKPAASTTVKTPKAKKMADAGDKPSLFYKSDEFKGYKKPSVGNLKAFLDKANTKKQSSKSTEVNMADEKKISAKEATIAVLAKAHELLKASKLAKADQNLPDGPVAQGEPKDNYNGNPAPGAEPKNLGSPYKGHIKLAKFMGRMEAKRKPAPVAAPAEPAATPAAGAPIEKATGHEKGVHLHSNVGSVTHDSERRGGAKGGANLGGVSTAGEAHREKAAGRSNGIGVKETHKQVHAEMKAIKPKLPG